MGPNKVQALCLREVFFGKRCTLEIGMNLGCQQKQNWSVRVEESVDMIKRIDCTGNFLQETGLRSIFFRIYKKNANILI